jgi:hypothetical protein
VQFALGDNIKVWKIKTFGSEKTRLIQESIYREIHEKRRANPEPQQQRLDPSKMRGQFRQLARPEEPPRHANYEQSR